MKTLRSHILLPVTRPVFRLIAAALLFTISLLAATRTRDGGGADAYWSAAANWQSDTAPASGDSLDFTSNTMNTNDTRLEVSVGYAAVIGDSFTIVNNTTANPVHGNFTSPAGAIAEGGYFTAPGGHTFRLTYTGGDGNDVVITKVTPPPAVFGALALTPRTGPEAGVDIVIATATGAAGLSHVLEASTSLSGWAALQTLTATASGALNFPIRTL